MANATAPRALPAGANGRADAALRPLLTVWLAWLTLMTGANLGTPLYPVYAARFGFSSLVLTLVFAVYAVVLVPALLLFGRLSDRFGRRPVVLAGLTTAAAALVVFAAAESTAWLFAARALQGLAVGMVSGAAAAALVELDPQRDGERPALLAGLAQAIGSGLGPLVAGTLAEWAPAPRQLCFLVLLGATALAGLFVLSLPEPAGRAREPWRIQWPRVPAEIRAAFARTTLTAATVWATLALFLSIVPSYASQLLGTHNLALFGAIGATALAASCLAQVVAKRRGGDARRRQVVGLVAVAAGLVVLALAAPLHSLAALLGGAVSAGAGHGLTFLSAQDELNTIAPAKRRGEVTAAFICGIYALVATAVIASGLLDLWVSLSVAVGVAAAAVAATALACAVWQATAARVSRPRTG
jgi:MFS family permease